MFPTSYIPQVGQLSQKIWPSTFLARRNKYYLQSVVRKSETNERDCDIVPVGDCCTVLLAGSSAEPVPDCGKVAVADSAVPVVVCGTVQLLWLTVASTCTGKYL